MLGFWEIYNARTDHPKPVVSPVDNLPPNIRMILLQDSTVLSSKEREYTVPPSMQLSVEDDETLDKDSTLVRFGKRRAYPDAHELPFVTKEAISYESRKGGQILIGTMSTNKLIGTKTPHGRYHCWAEVTDKSGSRAKTDVIEFNYVYRTNFSPLEKFLTVNSKDAFYGLLNGGLEIRNNSERGGFVSTALKQSFDLKTDFTISGRFTLKCSPDSPAGLDINLGIMTGATFNEKLAFIFPDGRLDTFSIKAAGEKRSDPNVTNINSRHRTRILVDGKTIHYFLIRIIKRNERGSTFELYITRESPDPRYDSPSHVRNMNTTVLGKGLTWIQIRLWQAGTLRLFNITVAEI